ncbi:alpha/beta fold hydrolase [Prosthecochloris vibrioformis]|uniref:Alpha/beta hydrolase n=1 Tax=Prosthecochloris vibrioformis TaxID=1098 RepID=A0A5C4S449_PROVB|nr:alpha/beta hydrolase [Prosthecochloris vibrioformis]TNJ37879.1 alpha/beta hydrolase [Prosthecochloris vibrioformis]
MLTYRERGLDQKDKGTTGHAVLLLHAFPLSAEMWEPQLDMLTKNGYVALAPNVYGVDGSPSRKAWTFCDYADELAQLLQQLGIATVTVVGLSMGGYQAFELWKRHPEQVASLVLCDTRAESDTPQATQNRQEFMKAVRDKGAVEAVRRMLPQVFREGAERSREEELFSSMVMQQSGEAIAETMAAIAGRTDSTPILETVTCPTTIITGTGDRLTPPNLAESMHRAIPHAENLQLDNAGHLSNMEQPEAFNRLLLSHLGKLRLRDLG